MGKRKKAGENSDDRVKVIDPERAVFIQGDLDDALVSNLTPQILALRKDPKKPITVFIDSPGGNLANAEIIKGLLKTPDQAGRTCWVNTVATGRAWSAAADLLTAGDYIISYPNACIRFHGAWTTCKQVTEEQAGYLQDAAISINKSLALTLTTPVFNRLLLNYEAVRDRVPRVRDALKKDLKKHDVLRRDGAIDVPAFVHHLVEKVNYPQKKLLADCLGKTSRMCALVREFHKLEDNRRNLPPKVRAALKGVELDEDGPSLEKELSLFNVLLAGIVKEDREWRLATQDFSELGQDFAQLKAMAYFQDEALERLVKLSDVFMPAGDLEFLIEHSEDQGSRKTREKCDEIIARGYEKIEPLWSFSLALCRELTKGEHPISPEDAWWLGLIDEVLGSPSLTRRTIREGVKESLIQNISMRDFDRFVDYERLSGRAAG